MNTPLKILVGMALFIGMAGASAQDYGRPRIADEGEIGDQWMVAEGAELAAPPYPAEFATGVSVSAPPLLTGSTRTAPLPILRW